MVPTYIDPRAFFGSADQTIRAIERSFPDIELRASDRTITIEGEPGSVQVVHLLLEELVQIVADGGTLSVDLIAEAAALLSQPQVNAVPTAMTVHGKTVSAKTPGQQTYMDALRNDAVVFGIGPAGTGKTYLAMAQAVVDLTNGKVKRIVMTRPAVEAGENLGFLPGSAAEKIDPYLRPLFDALRDLIDEQSLPQLLATGVIEVAPLAYMRGRTLNDAFIILDEAQNTTEAQMKMFLTRLGFNSKMVVTGDDSQIDLRGKQISGLVAAQQALREVDDVQFCYLTSVDVVRNPIVARIIDAYSRWETASAI